MGKPLLDVSEVLSDPLFQDTRLFLKTITESVGQNGIAVYTSTTTPILGVIQPTSDQLKRMADGSFNAESVEIWTKTKLISGQDGRTADEIIWKGISYVVVSVSNWDYGSGYIHAICQLVPVNSPVEA